MTFLDKITALMKEKNVNKSQLCKDLNINQNSFVNWTNRGTLPNGETIIALANYFNVTSDYLLGIERTADMITVPKDSLAALINNMSPEDQEALKVLVARLRPSDEKK